MYAPGDIIKPLRVINALTYVIIDNSVKQVRRIKLTGNELFLVLPRMRTPLNVERFSDEWLTVFGCGTLIPFIISDYFSKVIYAGM